MLQLWETKLAEEGVLNPPTVIRYFYNVQNMNLYHQAQNEAILSSYHPNTFTYGKYNTTNDNIDIYRKNLELRHNTLLNLNPHNSFSNNAFQSSNQLQNQNSQNLDQRQNSFNNNEINFESTTENNIFETQNYESTYGNNNNTINNTEEKKEKKFEDPEEELFD